MKKYNLTVPREAKNGKTYWDKVGVMFKRDSGGYSISLAMFPELKILAFSDEKKPAEDNIQRNEPADDIPF